MTIVVDAANVMGSRPDGWWRDRAGAAVRLHEQLMRLVASGRPVPLGGGAAARPEFVMVLEGAAKAAADRLAADHLAADRLSADRLAADRPAADPPSGGVRVVRAPGSGDDAIVAVVRELSGDCLVVTADRELRDRCTAAGAEVLGPGWLLDLLRS